MNYIELLLMIGGLVLSGIAFCVGYGIGIWNKIQDYEEHISLIKSEAKAADLEIFAMLREIGTTEHLGSQLFEPVVERSKKVHRNLQKIQGDDSDATEKLITQYENIKKER